MLLIASLAGVAMAGADAPTRLLDPQGQPPPAAYLSDFGRAMAHAGEYVAAARAWSKLPQPEESDRQLHFLVAAERRDPKEARAILKTLSAEAVREPALLAARLWTLAGDDKTRGEAAAAIKALAALPLDFKHKRLDAVLLFEAALVAGLPAEAAQHPRGRTRGRPASRPRESIVSPTCSAGPEPTRPSSHGSTSGSRSSTPRESCERSSRGRSARVG